jgi:FkbM family methyltransferase
MSANKDEAQKFMRSVARYLREPLWALRAGDSRNAAVLLANTARHHVANWLRLSPNHASTFTVSLDLGGAKRSIVTLRPTAGDVSILYEIFAEQSYWIPDPALQPESVCTVIDCGAHIGLAALYFAHRYPRARIIAIEPSPINFKLLVANTAQEPRVIPLQACVCDHSGVTRVSVDGPGWGHAIRSVGVEVNALTLEDIRDRFGIDRIDLLKMDVEGAEKGIFANNIGPVRAIAAELHGDYTTDQFARHVAPLKVSSFPGMDTVFALPQ